MTGGVHVIWENIDDPKSASTTIPVLRDAARGVFFRAEIRYSGAFTQNHGTGCLWR